MVRRGSVVGVSLGFRIVLPAKNGVPRDSVGGVKGNLWVLKPSGGDTNHSIEECKRVYLIEHVLKIRHRDNACPVMNAEWGGVKLTEHCAGYSETTKSTNEPR